MKMKTVTVEIYTIMFELLEAYCLGKGALWNVFFGFRQSIGDIAYYKISHKDLEEIYSQFDRIETFLLTK